MSGRAPRRSRNAPAVSVCEWAAALAASLPPLTRAEAAPIGQLAAVLDARCAQAAPQAEERRAA